MDYIKIDNKKDIKLHNVLFCVTSPNDYQMERLILLVDLDFLKFD